MIVSHACPYNFKTTADSHLPNLDTTGRSLCKIQDSDHYRSYRIHWRTSLQPRRRIVPVYP